MKKKYNKNKILCIAIIVIVLLIVVLSVFNIMRKDSEFIVSFNTDGGNNIISRVVESESIIYFPETPVKEGYTFIGWQLNGELIDEEFIVIENLYLTAVWENARILIDLNEEYEVTDYSLGTLCWTYSYPVNENEIFGVDLNREYSTDSVYKIIDELYKKEMLDMTSNEKEEFYNTKYEEVEILYNNLEYDNEKTNEIYEMLLSIEIPENIINYEVFLENNEITYYYNALLFEENDENLYNEYNSNLEVFNNTLSKIMSDAFLKGGGCGDYIESTILDEDLCDKYLLNCVR